ncbi:MAG: protein kinase [Planctomycetaceae bacterium]|nr:protein kinase [Planctomycetaceae bacterium]MBT6484393.1 protein kinase [Planctomycetaceae bacterium]MBT6498006.1 protein kinase [Planctomycetaceae bacterium]
MEEKLVVDEAESLQLEQERAAEAERIAAEKRATEERAAEERAAEERAARERAEEERRLAEEERRKEEKERQEEQQRLDEEKRRQQEKTVLTDETEPAGETVEPSGSAADTHLDPDAQEDGDDERPIETVDFDESAAAAMEAMMADDDIPEQFGRYHVLEQIGQGSMGAVYLAHDSQLDRKIALKIPRFSHSDKSEETERFYREARAAATLRHPNICQVFDIGEIEGQHFISMEYINGNPLSMFIKQSTPLPVRKIASTVRKLAKALQEAHDNGLVHRDLKPDNIMIDERGEPIIMDFGLVRLMDDDDRLTTSGAIVGSPAYMSPEQVSGLPGDVGPSSDIFSLGTITYELLTRRRPFRGNLSKIFDEITSVEPPLPSELRPEIDSEFESICLHMLAKEVSDRYGSMKDLADAVGSYMKEFSSSSILSSSSLPASPKETPPAAATSPDEEAARWVLKIGGALKVSTNESKSVAVADLNDLPDPPFQVVDIALLKNGEVDDDGLKFLIGLDKLLVLRLSETNVTDEGIACLGGLTSLPVLDLSYTKVTDAGLKHLKNLKGLKQLDLANTQITDLGLAHVKRLRGLQFLGLYATDVTDAGLKTLSRLKNLQFLGLYGTKVTDAGVATLKRSLRNCTISR